MNKKLLLTLTALLCLTLAGCKESGDTDEPSDDGGVVTPVPGLPACDLGAGASASGNYAGANGVYVSGVTAATTISSVTLNIAGDNGNVTQGLQLEAFECGFAGTSRGTPTASLVNMQSGTYKPVTFTFSPSITVANCAGGLGTVAFKLTSTGGSNTTGQLKIASILPNNMNCTMKVSDNVTTTPVVQRSTFQAIGTYAQ